MRNRLKINKIRMLPIVSKTLFTAPQITSLNVFFVMHLCFLLAGVPFSSHRIVALNHSFIHQLLT